MSMPNRNLEPAMAILKDPVTRSTELLIRVINEKLYELAYKHPELSPSYEPIYAKLHEFDFDYSHPKHGPISLEILMDSFEELVQLFEELEILLASTPELSMAHTESELMHDGELKLMPPMDGLSAWVLSIKKLTPIHVALQTHLTKLSYFELSPRIGVEALLLFEQLGSLRDEYFSTPQPELLGRYLRCVEAIQIDPRYLACGEELTYSRSLDFLLEHHKKIDRFGTELEVFSLLE
jgi:hypothetical protein